MTALKIAQYDDEQPRPTRTAEGNVRLPEATRVRDTSGGIEWSTWVDINRAALLLDKSVGHLKRRCPELAERGQAMKAVGPEGGQACWWIHQDYNLKLHESQLGIAHRVPDSFMEHTEAQRNQAIARATCVKRYRAILTRSGSGPRKNWIGGLIAALRADFRDLKISERSLYRWHQVYRNESDLVKLIDKRGGARKAGVDPAAWSFFCSLFLHPNKRTQQLCHNLTCDKAEAEGWRWHPRTKAGYKQTQRMVDDKLDLVVQTKARDRDLYRNTMSPHMVMDPDAFAPGERWQGDHCVLDLFCLFQGRVIRPWLTAWMDTKSRKCVGWVLCESPSSETIRAAFAQGMRDPANRGGPSIVHIDNGRDYKCEAFVGNRFTKPSVKLKKGYADQPEFHGLFGLLDIEPIFAIPKNSRGKGVIESWFGYSVHENFDKLWETYAGNKPENRPHGLTDRLKNKAAIPTFDQIHEAIAKFIADYNASAEHGKEDIAGQSPDQVMATAQMRQYADPGVLEFLDLTYAPACQVGRGVVTIRPLGKALRYSSPSSEFIALSKSKRRVRVGYRQNDLFGTVYIFDADTMKLLATAEHERAGTSIFTEAGRADASAALKKQRKAKRAAEVLHNDPDAAIQPFETLVQREKLRRLAAEQAGHREVIEEQGVKLVQTVLDGQSKRLQQTKIKKAVGAEHTGPVMDKQIILDAGLSGLALTRRASASRTKPRAATPALTAIDDITKLRPHPGKGAKR